jgi:hypothetical protein
VQNPKAIIIINNMARVSPDAWRVMFCPGCVVLCCVVVFVGLHRRGSPFGLGTGLRQADDIGGDREMITSAPLQLHVKPESRSGMLVFNLECRQKISTR